MPTLKPQRSGKAARLSSTGENGVIENIKRMFATAPGKGVITSIGDDASVTTLPGGKHLITTIDSLVEGVHFLRSITTPELLGEKLVNISVSDIAAMGGTPRHCLISITLPRGIKTAFVTALYKGIHKACRINGITLVGGNTTSSKNGITLNSVVLGDGSKNTLLLRSTARPGDLILVTGSLGDSALGLKLLKKQGLKKALAGGLSGSLALRHLCPRARTKEGASLAGKRLATSMMDISDGLLLDLHRLTAASRVGAEINARALPLSTQFLAHIRKHPKDIDLALTGGEDYELLFTAKPGNMSAIKRLFANLRTRITVIGKITRNNNDIKVINCPQGLPGTKTGYEHFKVRT